MGDYNSLSDQQKELVDHKIQQELREETQNNPESAVGKAFNDYLQNGEKRFGLESAMRLKPFIRNRRAALSEPNQIGALQTDYELERTDPKLSELSAPVTPMELALRKVRGNSVKENEKRDIERIENKKDTEEVNKLFPFGTDEHPDPGKIPAKQKSTDAAKKSL